MTEDEEKEGKKKIAWMMKAIRTLVSNPKWMGEETTSNKLRASLSSLQQFDENDWDHLWTSSEGSDDRVRCVTIGLYLLKRLQSVLISIPPSPNQLETLSIQDQGFVRSLFELIVRWGMVPCLDDGVGIPLSRRPNIIRLAYDTSVDYRGDDKMLIHITSTITDIALDSPDARTEIHRMIFTRHLSDLLACLIQVSRSDSTLHLHITPASLSQTPTPQRYTEEQKTAAQRSIHLLFDACPLIYAIEALFSLLSSPGPKWYSSAVGRLLSESVTRRQGLSIVMDRMLLRSNEVEPKAVDRCIQLVCTPPTHLSKEEYYEKMAVQLRGLVVEGREKKEGEEKESEKRRRVMSSVAEMIIGKMMNRERDLSVRYLLIPNISPFVLFLRDQHPSSNEEMDTEDLTKGILYEEKEISDSVRYIERLVVGNPPPYQYDILSALIPVMGPLFSLYCFTRRSLIINIRREIENIMKTFFTWVEGSTTVFKQLFVPPSLMSKSQGMKVMQINADFSFSAGPSGGAILRSTPSSERDFQWEAECAVGLLKEMGNTGLIGDLFVDLLNVFLTTHSTDEDDMRERLPLLGVLIQMMETFGDSVLRNVVQVCTFLRNLLESAEEEEMVTLALGVLTQLLSGGTKISKEEAFLLDQLTPQLYTLSGHEDEATASVAAMLVKKIELFQIDERDPAVFVDNRDDDEYEYSIQSIMEDLQSEMVPSRAYALVCLRKVVTKKSEETEKNVDKFIQLFRQQLRDEDSFVYLNAIQGLMALGDIYPARVIEHLLSVYTDTRQPDLERLKLGEAILYISKRCGETLPVYAPRLMNAFLSCTKDRLPTMRASSLSNLAELCKHMRFALHSYIVDIMECIMSTLSTDKEAEVRRGAVFASTLLFRGMGRDIFELIPTYLRSLYRLLKRTEESDADDVTRFHAKIALTELANAIQDLGVI
ncbi:hypothetical protein PROFUN_05044 [Planoprotostelium fungivorum]|uniref:RNA polymerase II assembly factor Rtp1 C-terminal domain-containing protein n=1 Tax=Planoprotostelium fungivorum TaxID=1890364 RepID=A0A2P6NS90_9EUKA|nr:hypothetical protein PROFUN_05044 [Planoprotostelium fungivorum]